MNLDKTRTNEVSNAVEFKGDISRTFDPDRKIDLGTSSDVPAIAVEKTDLTDDDRQRLKADTGWSDSIVGSIRWKEEADFYKSSNLVESEIAGRPCLLRSDIDMTVKDSFGKTNQERIEAGKAPIVDGKPIELHHIGQQQNSPLAELTSAEHKGNYSILHDVPPQTSNINREIFGTERNEHWKARGGEV